MVAEWLDSRLWDIKQLTTRGRAQAYRVILKPLLINLSLSRRVARTLKTGAASSCDLGFSKECIKESVGCPILLLSDRAALRAASCSIPKTT